jgi:hypothetical protein
MDTPRSTSVDFFMHDPLTLIIETSLIHASMVPPTIPNPAQAFKKTLETPGGHTRAAYELVADASFARVVREL